MNLNDHTRKTLNFAETQAVAVILPQSINSSPLLRMIHGCVRLILHPKVYCAGEQ
jgi:hypothetical protein